MANLPKRSREHVIEEDSEKFVERIIPSQWNQGRYKRDYGIDLLYEIAVNREMTGANFSIQLKSTDNLKINKQGNIPCSIETKTIRYFLERPEPVIFLIYDVKNDKGYWTWIQDFIRSELKPKWKTQKKATIRIPVSNVFDRDALRTIEKKVLKAQKAAKWLVATQTTKSDYFKYDFSNTDEKLSITVRERYPGATKDKPVESKVTFKFDESLEAQAALESLQRALKTGEPAIIDSRFFEGFKVPEVFSCLFSEDDWHPSQLEIKSAKTDRKENVRLSIIDGTNKVLYELPFLEFKIVQAGTEEITFSNEQQDIPFKVKARINKVENTSYVSLHATFEKPSVKDIQSVLKFKQALACGAWIRFTNLVTGSSGQDKIPSIWIEKIAPQLIEFVDDLVSIQEITKQQILWPDILAPGENLFAKEVLRLLKTGQVINKLPNLSLEIEKRFAKNIVDDFLSGRFPPLRYTYGTSNVNILGNTLTLGPCTILVSKYKPNELTIKKLQELESLPDESRVCVEISIEDPGIQCYYHDWLPENQLKQ